jgi:hypothetical protein
MSTDFIRKHNRKSTTYSLSSSKSNINELTEYNQKMVCRRIESIVFISRVDLQKLSKEKLANVIQSKINLYESTLVQCL